MTDNRLAQAFLDEIVVHPDDDTPRLVYADWLDEHGDAARAEFIRVQCRKAALPRWHREWPLLAWRERVLLARHENAWRAELPTIEGVRWGAFERGFVHEVEVDTTDVFRQRVEDFVLTAPIRRARIAFWGERDGSLGALSCLEELALQEAEILYDAPDDLFQSPLLSTVKTLDLSGLNMEGEHFAALGRSPHLANLETLILDDCYMGDGNLRPFVRSEVFRNLTRLSMKGNRYGYHEDARIRPADVALLARSPNLAGLRSLDLSGNEIDGPSLYDLLESPNLRNLRELAVSHNRVTEEGVTRLFDVTTSTRLHRLALDHNPVGEAGARLLATAPFCAELVDLDLDTCEIPAAGVRALAEAPWLGKLCRLNLDHNSATADGVHALAKAFGPGALSELHLRNNDLDAEAVALLADSPGLGGLHTLDLSENFHDAAAVGALAASPHLRRLQALTLNHCLLHEEEVRRLAAAPWLAGLVRLSLSENALSPAALSALFAGGRLARLNELSLHSCGLAASSVQSLAGAGLTELHWLDLSGNELGPAGVKALARSGLAATLVELNLTGCALGDDGVRELIQGPWPMLEKLVLANNQVTEKGILALAETSTMPRQPRVDCRNNRIEYWVFQKLGPRFQQY